MKLHKKYPTKQGGKRRRRLELAAFVPLIVATPSDLDAWVDDLTDEELGDIIGPSWAFLTGRNVDHFIPDDSASAA